MARRNVNRLAVEAELTGAELDGLAEFCRRRQVPRDRWHLVPLIRAWFESVAADRIVARLRGEGLTLEAAMDTAALRLGMEPETLQSRFKALPKQARGMERTRVEIPPGTRARAA
ncbi:MAG: hypothetical protein IRY92_06695 [Dactylosporangium sp.]|nr:hypothetical protein [Dactylosporangium sp.]